MDLSVSHFLRPRAKIPYRSTMPGFSLSLTAEQVDFLEMQAARGRYASSQAYVIDLVDLQLRRDEMIKAGTWSLAAARAQDRFCIDVEAFRQDQKDKGYPDADKVMAMPSPPPERQPDAPGQTLHIRTFNLSARQQAFIAKQADLAGDPGGEHYLLDLIEAQRDLEDLREIIRDGLRSGSPRPADQQLFDHLEALARQGATEEDQRGDAP